MSSTLEWLTQNVDFFCWTDSVFALRDTITAIRCYIKETVETFFKDKWFTDELSQMKVFIEHNAEDEPKLLCRAPTCDPTCKKFWKEIVENHNYKRPEVFIDTKSGYDGCEDWWTFLKFFLPEGYKEVTEFDKCDSAAICKILKRFLLFQDINETNLARLVNRRNKLMHSSTNAISIDDKRIYIQDMITFLETEPLQGRPEIKGFVKKLMEDKEKIRSFNDETQLNNYRDVKKALKVQCQAIEEDLRFFESQNITIPGLNEIKTLAIASLGVCGMIVHDLKLIGPLSVVTAMGGVQGKDKVGPLGFIPGIAAANFVGMIKRNKQQNNEEIQSDE